MLVVLVMFSLSRSQPLNVRTVFRAASAVVRALPFFLSRVPAGFPSPADDYLEGELDLNDLLIRNPPATFYVRLAGDSMIKAGLFDGDILIVDRAVSARHRHIVVAVVDGELTVKRLWTSGGVIELRPENPAYQPIKIAEGRELSVWGVVIGGVRQFQV